MSTDFPDWYQAKLNSKADDTPSSQTIAKPVLAAVPYQLCPKCNGQGTVLKPSHVAGDVYQWSSSSAVFRCDVCEGVKIIPMFIVEQKY